MVRGSRSYGLCDFVDQSGSRARWQRAFGLFVGRALAAVDAIKRATGEFEANVIGYCIGGTLVASTLAYMAATNDRRIASATLFTTLLDFSDVGDISVFMDEGQLRFADEHMNRLGYLEGHHMAEAFNLMRENDLVWFFVSQQLSAGPRSSGIRPPLLEFGFDPYAGYNAFLLLEEYVSPEHPEKCGGITSPMSLSI